MGEGDRWMVVCVLLLLFLLYAGVMCIHCCVVCCMCIPWRADVEWRPYEQTPAMPRGQRPPFPIGMCVSVPVLTCCVFFYWLYQKHFLYLLSLRSLLYYSPHHSCDSVCEPGRTDTPAHTHTHTPCSPSPSSCPPVCHAIASITCLTPATTPPFPPAHLPAFPTMLSAFGIPFTLFPTLPPTTAFSYVLTVGAYIPIKQTCPPLH